MAVAGRVLMIPAGTWTSGKNYAMLDVVIHAGSSYVAKKQINNSTVAPPSAASDWQLLSQGYDVTNLVTKSMIVNNFLATDPNTVLSGPMGKSLKDQFDTLNSNLNDVKNVSYSVGSGIDANSCSGGIIYLLKKNSLCQIRGSITIIAALNNDSSRSIFSPEFNGQAYSPLPDGMLLTYHVRYQDITGYLSYDTTTKTFRLFNYSGKTISANSFIEIWGSYVSNI